MTKYGDVTATNLKMDFLDARQIIWAMEHMNGILKFVCAMEAYAMRKWATFHQPQPK